MFVFRRVQLESHNSPAVVLPRGGRTWYVAEMVGKQHTWQTTTKGEHVRVPLVLYRPHEGVPPVLFGYSEALKLMLRLPLDQLRAIRAGDARCNLVLGEPAPDPQSVLLGVAVVS